LFSLQKFQLSKIYTLSIDYTIFNELNDSTDRVDGSINYLVGVFMLKNIILLSIACILVQSAFASSECERNVAANVLKMDDVHQGLERIGAKKQTDKKHKYLSNDSKNSIYFHTYQLAELVCKNMEATKRDVASQLQK